jgi:hypothetical protein
MEWFWLVVELVEGMSAAVSDANIYQLSASGDGATNRRRGSLYTPIF